MSIPAKKIIRNTDQSTEKNKAKKGNDFAPDFELEDNRPESAIQQKLQTAAANSIQSQTIGQFQQKSAQPIQRMVAINGYKNVYLPDYLKPDSKEGETRMKTSINTLTSRTDNLVFTDSEGITDLFTKNIEKETKGLLDGKKKYLDKNSADELTTKASIEQQDRTLGPEERQAITDKLGEDLDDLTNPTWKRNREIHHQFSKQKEVYLYKDDLALDSPYVEPTAFNLLAPGDMTDAPKELEEVGNKREICAIEAISDLGGDVKTMWPDLASSTRADAWHTACKGKGLDYRNDNEYIKILKKLKYSLVKNDSVSFDEIEWEELGDGYYFLATGSGDIGHAIGAHILEGAVNRIYDRQELHEDNVNVKYIFKKS